DVLKGDGGPGTILQPFTKPGTGTLFYNYEDDISKVDDENMVKEKSENSCITKVTVQYDVKEGFISNTSHVSIEPFTALVKYSNNHLINKHK
ncbi:hypothetical protein RJ639_008252, partial [Escallonia herrerae]